jgi:transposase
MWFAGIDWADQHHDVVALDAGGRQVGQLRVPHSAAGVGQLIVWLRQIGDIATCPEHLACLIETTHSVLITALLEHGFSVYLVNPKIVDRARRPSGAKTDAIDATILARLGRADLADLRRLQPDPPLIQKLKTLTRDQDAVIRLQTRLTSQVIACLKAYYPAALAWFDHIAQGVTLAILEVFPSPTAFQAATQEEFAALLTARHYPKAAQKAQAPHLHAPPAVARAKARYLLALAAHRRLAPTAPVAYQAMSSQRTTNHLLRPTPVCG